jgi:hypothetical protein
VQHSLGAASRFGSSADSIVFGVAVPAGQGINVPVAILVADQVTNSSITIAYRPPQIQKVSGCPKVRRADPQVLLLGLPCSLFAFVLGAPEYDYRDCRLPSYRRRSPHHDRRVANGPGSYTLSW